MKRYALLMLFPMGAFSSGNKVISETELSHREDAIAYFNSEYPLLGLNHLGYACGPSSVSYCVAEFYYPFSV